MGERTGLVTLMGMPVTLVGDEVGEGSKAPDFVVVNNDLEEVQFSNLGGKTSLILSVPSLDTPVCDMETRRFNEEASKLGDKVQVLVISMDLPFAQKRWCGAAGVDKVTTLSDHRDASFGKAYGVLIKEFRLLARAIFIVDENSIVRYNQLVKEIGEEPDYDAALGALSKVL